VILRRNLKKKYPKRKTSSNFSRGDPEKNLSLENIFKKSFSNNFFQIPPENSEFCDNEREN
jgi:hypothetical protein